MGDHDTFTFTMLQLNVLARSFTCYCWGSERPRPYDAIRGHLNSEKIETAAQTAARYKRTTVALIEQSPDVALLQEVEPTFFDGRMNPGADDLLKSFAAHCCFGGAEKSELGTVVLLRRDGALQKAPSLEVVRVEGSLETGDNNSKSSIWVPCQRASVGDGGGDNDSDGKNVIWVGTIHMSPPAKYPNRVRYHFKTTLRSVANAAVSGKAHLGRPLRLLLAGDFNASPSELDALVDEEAEGSAGVELTRLPLAEGTTTGLSSDFTEKELLDHILFSSKTLTPAMGGEPPKVEKEPESPYGDTGEPAEVVGGSDHVWIKARFQVLMASVLQGGESAGH